MNDSSRDWSVDASEVKRAHRASQSVMLDAPLSGNGIALVGVHSYPNCHPFDEGDNFVRKLAPAIVNEAELLDGITELRA